MKKLTLLIALLGMALAATAQDTIRTHIELRTTVVKRTVVDTMPAKVSTDKMALDVQGDVRSVTSRTYDYLNNTVVEETRVLDEQGYCLSTTRKIGRLGGSSSYASMQGDSYVGGSIEYTNVITMNNTYKNGKISKIEVQDMERGDYEINYRYDLVGNVIGHDTVYDGVHHTDYTARFDKYHNPTYIRETTGAHTDNEYTFSYQYASDQHGKILRKSVERYNKTDRTSMLSITEYQYDEENRLVRESTTSDEGDTDVDYTYNHKNQVIKKDTKAETTKFEEIIERDSYGSCVLRKIMQDGKVILQIFNDITYGQGGPAVS